jgi:lipopolysaccharide transport system permease protein
MSNNVILLEEKKYISNNRQNIFKIFKEAIYGYKSSFYLAKQLAKRDIKAQYRQSVFGYLWAIVPVVMSAAVWIFLQSSGTVKLSDTGMPYPLFVVIGTACWSIVGECLLLPINNINSNKSILTKINFPREALITLGVLRFFSTFIIKLGLIICCLIFFKVSITASILLFIPILLVTVVALTSIGIILVPFGVLYTDISRLIPIAMQLLMYASPVVYMVPKSGLMKHLMQINPMSYILIDLRNSLTGHPIEHTGFLIIFTIFSLLLTAIAIVVYRISIPIITERLSS